MSTVVKDLGAVSAYAYAVEKGYTGTEAEFAELMADYAEVGQRAEDAADSALESKTAAQTAATTATNKASEATTAAQTATTKAGEASQSASQASASAQTASTKASEANASASTASSKAEEAAQSATSANTAKVDAVTAKTAAETAQGKAEDAQAAAEAVAESIPSDYSQLSADVSTLKENLSELQDGGYVADQQKISEKINDWLDDHPEATTTVEDGSLTYSKFVKGTMGYVIPQQFGAKGDGVTDDSLALKACMDYAIANNYAVHLPMGTYIVTHNVLAFSIADGQSLVVIGDGQNTIIKRKDGSLNTKWAQIFTIEPQPVSVHANDVIFSNFCIDGNRRGQGEIASDSYAYEAAQNISIRNGSNLTEDEQYLDRFIVSHMRFYDPVADNINVSASGQLKVRDVLIDHIVATDRHGTRNDIGITGNPLHLVQITDCDCDSIHFEYNQTPTDEQIIPYIISNCRFGVCTLGAEIDLNMIGCVVTGVFSINSFRTASISACDLMIGTSGYTVFSASGKCKIQNCLIRLPKYLVSENTEAVFGMYIRDVISCLIQDCDFVYIGETLTLDLDGDEVMDHISGAAITIIRSMVNPVVIDNCRFDERIQFCFANDGNNIEFKNIRVKTAYICNHHTVSTATGIKMTFDNVRLETQCLGALAWGNIAGDQEVDGTIVTLQNNFKHYGNNGTYIDKWYQRCFGNYHRTVFIDEPLTLSLLKSITSYAGYQSRQFFYLIKGDVFVYQGDDAQHYPEKWVVLDDGGTILTSADALYSGTALEDRIASVGSGYGASTDRPTCYLSKGFTYYDTDLGKPIYWNGTGWVDCTGTAVASS